MKAYYEQAIIAISVTSFALSCAMLVSAYVSFVNAQEMSSPSFKIQSDSVNFGGERSTSTSYTIEDTAGEIATGVSTSSSFVLKAGYQQMQASFISVVPPSNVTLSPSIGGVTGGTSNGSTSFTVTTDNAAGYTGTIKASSSPALQSDGESFADYAPAGANPDFSFAISAAASVFGFSPEGLDIATRFKDNGASCNAGTGDTTGACWDGLSTSPKTIVNRTTSNQPVGTATTLKFRAASGASHIQPNGLYTATTTLTILPL